MKNEIYCKDCQHCKYLRFYTGYCPRSDYVCIINSKSHVDAVGYTKLDKLADCNNHNSNHDCKDFKQKKPWWKLGVL